MEEHVILVDRDDNAVGVAEKMQAHREALLHRAFSVLVFDRAGALLLQRRAAGKYHSGGLWSNTCCGHPRPGEDLRAAARRRLREEMGFDCPLDPVHRFIYRTPLDHGLHEHEVDHVLVGRFDGAPRPDAAEVAEIRWAAAATLHAELDLRPADFTVWFPLAMAALAAADADGSRARAGVPANGDAR